MRNIALFLAAAGLGAATALAGPANAQTPEEDTGVVCDRLNYRFQFDFKYRKDFPQAEAARALHRSGVEKCESGNPEAGIADLRDALRKIEVEPERL
ncbi:hypothetical protein [Parvibaculum sp.]|uniref:hypothetical protein n=1 Tax=Parvibaculum sp. TaxID=2024848 RepID=UPI002629CFD0|nr:hypothetical protein [Parvibaculum sp.]MCW5726204.1 hypothetical protein [Parvibaculum sp.]